MPRNPEQEARRTSRVPLGIWIEVRCEGLTCRGTVRNLSLGGVAADLGAPLPEGTDCQVTLQLDGGAESMPCQFEARVVRSTSEGTHLAFTAVVGLDGLEHLHHLLLYNASDPERVAGEFQQFIGLRPRA